MHTQLSDTVIRASNVIEEAHRNSSRFRAMAATARDMAIESFNALAQLDSVIWSLLRAHELCDWTVRAQLRQL